MRRSALALLALLAAAPCAARGDDTACRVDFLRELGWRIVERDVATASIVPGRPCDRADLDEALRAGDLRATLPRDARARAVAIDALFAHPATRCAWRYRYGAATRAAIDRLVANDGFRFSGLQARWVSFGLAGAEARGWRPIASFGRAYVPSGSNTRAIGAFTQGAVRGECGLGRQVAQYATFAELFGPEGFDRMFRADEIAIGTFRQIERTASVIRGSGAGEMFADGAGRKSAALGRQAFVGAPGFVVHVFDRSTLRDPANQALNFVVYDVDAPAAEALRRHGGFRRYNALNRELWALSRRIDPRDYRGFERLLHARDAKLAARLPEAQRATLARMHAILDDAFYRGFRIYVHDHGVNPVGFHIARELDRNPGTPYRIELALHNLDTELFDRYARFRIDACAAQGGLPAGATTP
ncbi:MAG TPA: hypothetical protein VFO79_16315 [Xanthomonadales bacterium]|nr:hypothetical protein [Xanthomonadales bacterium]